MHPSAKPIYSVTGFWHVKIALALSLSLLYQLVETTYVLLHVDLVFLVGLGLLIFFDFASGVYFAWKRGEDVSFERMRPTFWKPLEFGLFLAPWGILHHMALDTWAHAPTEWAFHSAIFFLAITEIWSIIENYAGSKKRAKNVVRQMIGIWRRKKEGLGLEQVAEDDLEENG